MISKETLPTHWDFLPIRAIFEERKESNKNEQVNLILSLVKDIGIIKYSDKGNIGNKSKNDLSQYKIARDGDLVFNKMNAVIGSLGVSNYIGLVSPIYLVLYLRKPFQHNINYFGYFFQIKSIQESLSQYAYGIMKIRESIDYTEFKKMKLPIPPLEEQNKIVNILNIKISKIDTFIKKKKKFIELLKEQKEEIINQAVTKGIDKSVELKDSGIEWLGKIPKHWEIEKLKYIANIVLGKMLCNEDKGNYQYKPYLKSKNIQWLNTDVNSVEKMWFSKSEMETYLIKKDDLLLSEGGEVGKTCIWNNELDECYIQNSVHKVTFNKNTYSKFYLYLFFSYGKIGYFNAIVNRVSIAHLVLEKLENLIVIVPPLEEQKKIVTYIETELFKIDTIIEKTQKEIELIQEYKRSFISEIVMGKGICNEL